MSGNGELVPLPDRGPAVDVDRSPPREPRSGSEIVKEAVLAFPHLSLLLFRLLREPRVPLRRKLVAAGAALYAISPVDLIPDRIPVFGKVDDILIVAFALDHLMRGTDRDVVLDHWPGTEDAFELVAAIVAWAAELVPAPIRKLAAR